MKQIQDYLSHIYLSKSFWQIFTLISIILNVYFLIIVNSLKKKLKKNIISHQFEETIIKEGKDAKVSMDNVLNSIYKSKSLYDSLIRKVHPNRFAPDEALMKIADEIAAEITQNKNNYDKLLELQAIATEKLGITF